MECFQTLTFLFHIFNNCSLHTKLDSQKLKISKVFVGWILFSFSHSINSGWDENGPIFSDINEPNLMCKIGLIKKITKHKKNAMGYIKKISNLINFFFTKIIIYKKPFSLIFFFILFRIV